MDDDVDDDNDVDHYDYADADNQLVLVLQIVRLSSHLVKRKRILRYTGMRLLTHYVHVTVSHWRQY